MTEILRKAWSEYVQPLLLRPDRFQMAALCYRREGDSLQVLLITSLDTGRWIIPKGWPIPGRDAVEGAVAEAWQEAGVVPARVDRAPLGSFRYRKRFKGGAEAPTATKVFPVEVASLAADFPQKERRRREWVKPEEAARAVDEPGLRDILTKLPQLLADRGL